MASWPWLWPCPVEETALRARVVPRELMIRRWQGRRPLTEEELARKRELWAASINCAALFEFVAIFVSAAMIYLFQDHRYVFNFGYLDDKPVNVNSLLFSVMFQFIMEILIDTVSLFLEVKQSLPVLSYLDKFTSLSMVVFQLICAVFAVIWSMFSFKTVPM